MNIINIENIEKLYGDKLVFNKASLGIQKGDKLGIVGLNGAGKSTLLKIICGEEVPDKGQVTMQNSLKVAYLSQNPELPNTTIESYIKGIEDNWKIKSILQSLNITDLNQNLMDLSGGEKRRIALAKVLAFDFDCIVLDEPTNHLDDNMISWLEDYLKTFKGTIIMVTHDRYFLDKVTNGIVEISDGNIYRYNGNYSYFLEEKSSREEMELSTLGKNKNILRNELSWAMRGCRARSTKQRARLDRLETLKNKVKTITKDTLELSTVNSRMGKKTINLENISKSYENKILFKDFTYIFPRKRVVGIVGENGCGKSTLIKIINGEVQVDSGIVDIGQTIKIAYLSQEEEHLDENERVIDYITNIAPNVQTTEGSISASKFLERFLFDSNLQYSPIGKLSGGEKRRLHLCGVLCKKMNVLLLDEATNNLDIPTLEILEDFINNFDGIVISISHDRYFLDSICDEILSFENQKIIPYQGGYTDYINKRIELNSEVKPPISEDTEKNTKENKKWKKPNLKIKFSYNEQREFETIDDEIASLEEKLEKAQGDVLKYATDVGKLMEATELVNELEEQLNEKMERWMYLQDKAEQIKNQNEASN